MKFTAKRKSLAEAIKTVSLAISPRATLPILANILLTVKDGKLTLVGTDLDRRITTALDLVVNCEDGSATIPGRKLQTFVESVTADDISIETDGNQVSHIKSGTAQVHLPGIATDGYPEETPVGETKSFRIPASKLKLPLDATAYCVAPNDSRKVLEGINLVAEETGALSLAATDGKRLSVAHAVADECKDGINAVIPVSCIPFIKSLKPEADVTAMFAESVFILKTDNAEYRGKLIAGTFPDWKRIVPKNKHFCDIPVRDFMAKLGMVNSMADIGLQVALVIQDGSLTIKTVSSQISASDTVSLTSCDATEPVTIHFNGGYLSDAFRNATGEISRLSFDDGTHACKVDVNADVFSVIMPMRPSEQEA